jgi:NDP-sugar pyrophosphorylase family protein
MKHAPLETSYEAIILCGGSAKRMKPYLPFNKALAELAPGQTLLEHQIAWLKRNNAKQITLAVDTKTYSDLSALTPHVLQTVHCSIETTKLGTGGAVWKAACKIDSPLVYVMNVDDIIVSDTFTPRSLVELTSGSIKGTLLVTRTCFPFGVIETQDQYISMFREKPTLDYWINTGHCVLNRDYIEAYFPELGDMDQILPTMARQRVLLHHPLEGDWFTVNNIKQLEQAREKIEKLSPQPPVQLEQTTNIREPN